jgi:hypothetical protein
VWLVVCSFLDLEYCSSDGVVWEKSYPFDFASYKYHDKQLELVFHSHNIETHNMVEDNKSLTKVLDGECRLCRLSLFPSSIWKRIISSPGFRVKALARYIIHDVDVHKKLWGTRHFARYILLCMLRRGYFL